MRSFADIVDESAATAVRCLNKEPEQLTDDERIALAVVAGCELHWTSAGCRIKNRIGIQKINGRFVVREERR